jgi:hypothetical protein
LSSVEEDFEANISDAFDFLQSSTNLGGRRVGLLQDGVEIAICS